jgi:hypothetical protein
MNLTLNLNLLHLLEVIIDESTWKEISLLGMWDRDSLYQGR